MQLSISEENLERELARSREPGKEVTTLMATLPVMQLKHITRLLEEMNMVERSSRYEWRIASLGQGKPSPQFENVPQTMWTIMRRERLEKSQRKSGKSSSRHSHRSKSTPSKDHTKEDSSTDTAVKIVDELTQEAAPSTGEEESYDMPSPWYSYAPYRYYYAPPPPPPTYPMHYPTDAYMPYHMYPQAAHYSPPADYYYPQPPSPRRKVARSWPSMDSLAVEVDSEHPGYLSDGSDIESVDSNLTFGSSASSGSQTSAETPPHGAPLRGILRKSPKGLEMSIPASDSPDTSSEPSTSHELSNKEILPRELKDESQVTQSEMILSRSVLPHPCARFGIAPHALDDARWREMLECEDADDYDSSSSAQSNSSTRKIRFSDVAEFFILYEHGKEPGVEAVEALIPYKKKGPSSLVDSKYVSYGSD